MGQAPTSYVIIHGAFARPSGKELMEVAALQACQGKGDVFRSLVRCDVPDTPKEPATDGSSVGVSEEENRNAPACAEVFTHLDQAFDLGQALVVMWGGMTHRFHMYARERQLPEPYLQTRVIDLQAAVVLHFDLKTSECRSPRSVVQVLDPASAADFWSAGSVPFVRAMDAILGKLLAAGWTPESTPAAVTNGCDIGEVAEAMRTDRWEQIRDRQNNLGIERRPVPDVTPAFILLDCETATLRNERISRLIEVALVVAHRTERQGDVTYEPDDKPFASLVQLRQVDHAWAKSWEITGIDPEAVRSAPPLPRVMAEMVAAAPWETGVLVTWGSDDALIITQNCVKAGIPSPITGVPLINLQRMFSRFYGLGSQQVGLQNAASLLHVDLNGLDLHRALADTLVTWQILDRMLTDGWTPQWRPGHRVKELAPLANGHSS